MPYTGLIILAFVVFHLFHFTFVDKTATTIFDLVTAAFNRPEMVALYSVLMVVVALHVRHGFWSAFQTIGANHPKYMPTVSKLSIAAGLAIAAGFGLLPIVVSLIY
jgi:succinate dehydrogenase / fumarate reductase cytochrome b subunit